LPPASEETFVILQKIMTASPTEKEKIGNSMGKMGKHGGSERPGRLGSSPGKR